MLTSEIRNVLELMYEVRTEMVPCFIGPPGISKTQQIYKFAEDKGINVVTFILSNTVPSEVSGIRMPDKDTKKMEVFDDMRMASLKDGDILFFDEILEAPPMLWSACLTLIQDRIMASGRKLPDVFIVAASNEVASPGIIPPSVRNRFQFLQLQFDKAGWKTWMMDTYGVDVPDTILSRIQYDSTTYNIFTPREATKWYITMKKAVEMGTKQVSVAHETITEMFDAVIANGIKAMANQKPGHKRQLRDALLEINPDIELPENFLDMSFKGIMETLQARDDWEDLSLCLANIELQ